MRQLLLIIGVMYVTSCDVKFQLANQCSCEIPQGGEEWTEKMLNYTLEFNGTIRVALPRIHPGNRTIELRVQEIDAESCPDSFKHNRGLVHSQIRYEIRRNNCHQCQNDLNGYYTTFDYIFTGCYRINILEDNATYHSRPTFISTNYTKSRLANVTRVLKSKPIENGGREIAFQVSTSHFPRPPDICSQLFGPEREDQCPLTSLIKEGDVPRYNSCRSTNVTWNCSYRKQNSYFDLVCHYFGLDPGDYIVHFDILNEHTRCNPDSLWAVDPSLTCLHAVKLVIPKEVPASPEDQEVVEYQFDLYVIIFPVLLMLLILICIIYKKVRMPGPSVKYNNSSSFDENCPLNAKEILLVYARDHPLFHDVIQSFKSLFTSVGRDILIHDLNDDNEEISADSARWIMQKIEDNNVVIVLFINWSGWLIYSNPNITYRFRRWQDPLFSYAVKLIKMSKARNYTNLFVFETDVSPHGKSTFDDINPGTRFSVATIPTLLEEIFVTLEEPPQFHLHEVQMRVANYNTFTHEHPDFVQYILVKIR